jgi:hypothetical protein
MTKPLPAEAGACGQSRLKLLCSIGHCKCSVWSFRMSLKICFDHLIRHYAQCRTEIPPRPKVSPPIPLAQTWIRFLQSPRRLTLDVLHQLRYRHLRWHRHEQMHMVTTHVSTDDPHSVALADRVNQVSHPQCQIALQDLVAILRHPYKVILDVVNRMRSFTIVYHFFTSALIILHQDC